MSDDLIERLRGPMFKDAGVLEVAVLQAAAKIIEQADEIKRLRDALVEIRQMETAYANATVRRMVEKAIAALGETK